MVVADMSSNNNNNKKKRNRQQPLVVPPNDRIGTNSAASSALDESERVVDEAIASAGSSSNNDRENESSIVGKALSEQDNLDSLLNEMIDLSDEIVNERVQNTTRIGYSRTLVFMKDVCSVICKEALDETTNKFVLPLPKDCWKKFLGEVAKDRDNGSIRAVSTINSYINAMKFYHTENSVQLPSDVRDFLDKFVEGYKRRVAKKKVRKLFNVFVIYCS